MKVMMVANDESTILNFRKEIILALISDGLEVVVCYPLSSNVDQIRELGCRLRDVKVDRHGKNPLADIRLWKHFERLIREERPDVVLTYTVKPNVYGTMAAHKLKVPCVSNVTGLGSTLQNPSPIGSLVLFLQKKALRYSSCIFFQNKANRDKFIELGVLDQNAPAKVLPGSGVNLQKMSYVPYPEDDGVTRIAVVSRLRADKGYPELLEAFEGLDTHGLKVELHVVGWSEDDALLNIVTRLDDEGRVVYHGKISQEQVHTVVARCDCLIHPSHHEGMSNVLLEAAATGRVVLASDIPGCRETFDEGASGFGFEPGSAESIRKAMEKFLGLTRQERIEMGERGRAKVEKEFDRNIVAREYLDVIHALLQERPHK